MCKVRSFKLLTRQDTKFLLVWFVSCALVTTRLHNKKNGSWLWNQSDRSFLKFKTYTFKIFILKATYVFLFLETNKTVFPSNLL